MKLCALVNIYDTICWRLPVPHSIVKESLDAVEDDLENAEAATETLTGQEVSLSGNLSLFCSAKFLNVRYHLEG